MAKLFISYARPTVAQARLIAETLRGAGHQVWMDDELLAHRPYTDSIEEQLHAADAVIVVWSNDAVRSEWVRSEANRARHGGKLVQVRLERCQLPMPFDQTHCVDLSSWSGDYGVPAWRSVLASIAAVMGAPRAAASSAPAAKPAPPGGGERRQVTALFCDLSHSGPLDARLDPEDMFQVVDAYQTVRDDIIAQHGGAITQSAGHGLLAYFGYPRADEEEAANAVRAGIALCDAVGALELPAGVVLQTRVGIATGLVVIADLARRGGGQETGVVGETPNLAAKLATIAPPNGVVVSEATWRITDGLFTYRGVDATAAGGYDAPLRAGEVLEATAISSRSQARTRIRITPVFGRDAELALMSECWALVQEGEGQVILLQGEAGIGKSRLVEAFRQRVADSAGAQTTWYCAPNYSDSALHPVSEQLARAAGLERADGADTRRDKLASFLSRIDVDRTMGLGVLANLVGDDPPADSPFAALTPEKRKAVTLDTVLGWMDRAADAQPALFVVEDLHWADPTTLELLDRATRRAADRRWLILATARPEFEHGWSANADVTHIQLDRLNGVDAGRICTELGADALLPADTVREIVARSDGNPLFVEEMTKSVLDALAHSPASAVGSKVSIPNTLQDSLAARLDRLGAAKRVANLGAAIGRRFSYELLAAVAPQPAAQLRQDLRELTRSGLLERSGVPPNSHYLFKHALIRDAAYESLLKREREALHGRIAAALREQFQETLQTEPALVAHHLMESGAIAEAVPLWAQAGQRAASQAAHAEAASHFRTALTLVRRLPSPEARPDLELQFLLGLAASLSALRGYSAPEVGEALAEARAICDSLGNAAGLFVVLRAICSFRIVESDFAAAEEAGRRCEEIAEQTGLVAHRIEADDGLGSALFMRGELAAARRHLEQAVGVYRDNDGSSVAFWSVPGPLAICLGYLPLIHYAMGDNLGAERAAAEMVAHLAPVERNYDVAYGTVWLAIYHLLTENHALSLHFSGKSLAICEENGYEVFAGIALVLKASAVGRQGELYVAIEMASRAVETLDKLGVRSMFTFFVCQLAELQALAGDTAAALSTIDRAIAHSVEYGDRFYLSPAYRRRAEILAQNPGADPAEISEALRQAVVVAEAQGASAFAARAKSLLARQAA